MCTCGEGHEAVCTDCGCDVDACGGTDSYGFSPDGGMVCIDCCEDGWAFYDAEDDPRNSGDSDDDDEFSHDEDAPCEECGAECDEDARIVNGEGLLCGECFASREI